jgi:predicted ester cyclase
MKPATPKEVINLGFERVWKARDKSVIEAMMAEDAVAHLAGGAQVCGIAQFSEVHGMFFVAFLDLSVRVLRSVGDDTQAYLHWEAFGTHKGEFAGIASTNRKVASSGMSFVMVRDGKIIEGWDCWDLGTLTTTLSSPIV